MKNAPRWNIQSLLQKGRNLLQQAHIPQSEWDALLLLSLVLKREKEFILGHPKQFVSRGQTARYQRMIHARCQGTPMQYLIGVQEFWGRPFRVNPSVLIPRPETELLVEKVLQYQEKLKEIAGRQSIYAADIGTGSGCLAVTMALELEACQVFAVDISAAALGMARRNASRLGASHSIRFLCGNSVEPLLMIKPSISFHLVVSNPPYVALADREKLDRQVREFEPPEALFAGSDGLDMIRRLVPRIVDLISPGGLFLMEIGCGQEKEVRSLFTGQEWSSFHIWSDFNGIPRCVEAWKTGC